MIWRKTYFGWKCIAFYRWIIHISSMAYDKKEVCSCVCVCARALFLIHSKNISMKISTTEATKPSIHTLLFDWMKERTNPLKILRNNKTKIALASCHYAQCMLLKHTHAPNDDDCLGRIKTNSKWISYKNASRAIGVFDAIVRQCTRRCGTSIFQLLLLFKIFISIVFPSQSVHVHDKDV